MALILLIAAATTFSAEPARLVLGKDPGADLELQAPAGAKVTFSSSVGTVSPAREKDGAFHARFTPPPLRAPSVALVLAQIESGGDRELRWLAIPLSGSDTMEIETKPGSEVVATVAGLTVGPVNADARGIAKLPMIVPPGVDKATLKITDRLGNTSEKPLDLDPPPFSRIRVASRQAAVSSASSAAIEVFVVKPDGTPDDQARVEVGSDAGGDIDARGRIAPGVFLVEYTPPEGRTSGTVELDARASGQLGTLELAVRPLAPGEGRALWPSTLGAQRPWSISTGLLAGGGLTFNGAGEGTGMIEGAVRLGANPFEATLDLGGSFFGWQTQNAAIPALAEQVKPHLWFGQVGLRASRQLASGLDGQLRFAFGLQHQSATRTLPANIGSVADSAWAARIVLAAGAAKRLGPGRVLAQLQFEGAPHDVAHLAGSTSGISVLVGYLYTVR